MNKEEKRGVYKFLHWACFVASCLAVISAYIVQGMENMGSDNTGVVMFAHTAALAQLASRDSTLICCRVGHFALGDCSVLLQHSGATHHFWDGGDPLTGFGCVR